MIKIDVLEDSKPILCLLGLVRMLYTRSGTPKMRISRFSYECPACNRRDLYPGSAGLTFQLLKYVDPHLMNKIDVLEGSNPTSCLSGLVRMLYTRSGTPKMDISRDTLGCSTNSSLT